MLVVLADGSKLPPCMIVHCRTMPRVELLRGIIVRCQPKCLMTHEFGVEQMARCASKKMGDVGAGCI
jgi:hypothetical protein